MSLELEINTSFTSNPDGSITWKALEYEDDNWDYHEAILDGKWNPCTINIYQSFEWYELSNSKWEIFLPMTIDSIHLLSVMEYMANCESIIQEQDNAILSFL